jgi:hypothetical protein
MDGSFLLRRSRAAVTSISRKEVPSKFWKRNELTTQACTARSSMLAGTLSWRTPTRTWRCLAEENSFLHRCIISCGSPEQTECMPGTSQAIRRRMAVSGCRNSTRLHSSTQSVLGLRSRCTGGRQPAAIWGNRGRHFQWALIDLGIRASTQDLHHLRHLGGGDKAKSSRLNRRSPADVAAITRKPKARCGLYVTAAVRAPSYQHYSHSLSSVRARDQPGRSRC